MSEKEQQFERIYKETENFGRTQFVREIQMQINVNKKKDKEIERLNNIINKIDKLFEADTHCEDLLVDGYDYNPHTCMVEVPYNDYWDMKDKCKENKQLKSQLQQKENIIKEVREYAQELRLYDNESIEF